MVGQDYPQNYFVLTTFVNFGVRVCVHLYPLGPYYIVFGASPYSLGHLRSDLDLVVCFRCVISLKYIIPILHGYLTE